MRRVKAAVLGAVDLRRDHREMVADKHDVRVDRRQIRRTVTP